MIKTIRSSLVAAGLLSSLVLSVAPATAATKVLGTSPSTIVDLSAGDTGTGGSYTTPSSTIADNYYFRSVGGNSGQFNLLNAAVVTNGMNFLNIGGLSASLYDLTTSTLVGTFGGTTDPTAVSTLAIMSGDSYRIGVSGTTNGMFGGFYNLRVSPQAVAPLPGPSGWAVALIGGGLLAFGIRRRRNTGATVAA